MKKNQLQGRQVRATEKSSSKVDAMVAFLEGQPQPTTSTESVTWTRDFTASGSGKTGGGGTGN